MELHKALKGSCATLVESHCFRQWKLKPEDNCKNIQEALKTACYWRLKTNKLHFGFNVFFYVRLINSSKNSSFPHKTVLTCRNIATQRLLTWHLHFLRILMQHSRFLNPVFLRPHLAWEFALATANGGKLLRACQDGAMQCHAQVTKIPKCNGGNTAVHVLYCIDKPCGNCSGTCKANTCNSYLNFMEAYTPSMQMVALSAYNTRFSLGTDGSVTRVTNLCTSLGWWPNGSRGATE